MLTIYENSGQIAATEIFYDLFKSITTIYYNIKV